MAERRDWSELFGRHSSPFLHAAVGAIWALVTVGYAYSHQWIIAGFWAFGSVIWTLRAIAAWRRPGAQRTESERR